MELSNVEGTALAKLQFTEGEHTKGKAVRYTCVHCQHSFMATSVSRLINHLLGNSSDVRGCTGNTPELRAVQQKLARRLNDKAATGAAKQLVAVATAASQAVAAAGGATALRHKRSAVAAAVGAAAAAAMAAPIPTPFRRLPQPSYEHVDDTICTFFYTNGVPLSAASTPQFQRMCAAVAAAGPSYRPPSLGTLRTTVLDRVVRTMRRAVEDPTTSTDEGGDVDVHGIAGDPPGRHATLPTSMNFNDDGGPGTGGFEDGGAERYTTSGDLPLGSREGLVGSARRGHVADDNHAGGEGWWANTTGILPLDSTLGVPFGVLQSGRCLMQGEQGQQPDVGGGSHVLQGGGGGGGSGDDADTGGSGSRDGDLALLGHAVLEAIAAEAGQHDTPPVKRSKVGVESTKDEAVTLAAAGGIIADLGLAGAPHMHDVGEGAVAEQVEGMGPVVCNGTTPSPQGSGATEKKVGCQGEVGLGDAESPKAAFEEDANPGQGVTRRSSAQKGAKRGAPRPKAR